MASYKGAASEAGRAYHLKKKREKAVEELEHRKKKIEEELKLPDIENKFASHYDAVEQQLKSSTIGLLTLDELKAKQEDVVKEREQQLAQIKQEADLQVRRQEREKQKKKEKQKRQIALLSFAGEEEEEEEEEENLPPKKVMKNPNVDTSFLPDRERDEEERRLREELRQQWEQQQQKIKNEEIEITFSYWDGSGHRNSVKMKKGNSIYQFLQKCLELLRKEFPELRVVTADQLMYVKEDLIIAHHYTFYDFILTKARGKSGPLFDFTAHDDIRATNDASIEKNESHAGKVLLRSWYERNKHIFPASRWEPYDPAKSFEKYTIGDRKH